MRCVSVHFVYKFALCNADSCDTVIVVDVFLVMMGTFYKYKKLVFGVGGLKLLRDCINFVCIDLRGS